MYTYYMLAAIGPHLHKYLWWKKYITDLQMVSWGNSVKTARISICSPKNQIQFGMAFMHSAQLLWTDCGYPRWSVCFTLPNAIFFYMLFNDFYKKTYTVKRAARLAASKAKAEELRKAKELESLKAANGKLADKEL